MLDLIFYWTGALVWGLCALALLAGSLVFLSELVAKKLGTFWSIVLSISQRNAEKDAINNGDEVQRAWAHELLDQRIHEARKRKGVAIKEGRKIDP